MKDTKSLNVSELDFNEIKKNLKLFLSDQNDLTDYDFEGSAISTLLDVAAYITHMNALNANQAINETFLDTAQLRSSVVSHAKLLGYTPRSAYAPVAYVNLVVNDGPVDTPLNLFKGTRFRTIIDGKTYTFVTTATISAAYLDGVHTFNNVRIIQGEYKQTIYYYDVNTSEKFVIPFDDIVTDTLSVNILPNKNSSETEVFVHAPNLVNINDTSSIYFLNESMTGEYEVQFGDGVFGKALSNGNVIQMDFVTTDGDASNGAQLFTMVDSIEGSTDVNITVVQKAIGGTAREDIESIRFNAPLLYTTQNRTVTPNDYRVIIENNYGAVDAIAVWGGEDSIPPDYGKVYIAIKPKDAEVLTDNEKEIIINQYLKPKSIVSITPVIVDPEYTYIDLEVFFKYSPNFTSLSKSALETKVRTTIEEYNDIELSEFNGVFRYSNLLAEIDDTDKAILNTNIRAKMIKKFIPYLLTPRSYTLTYSNGILVKDNDLPTVSSTTFTYLNNTCTFTDQEDILGNRILKIKRLSDQVIVNENVGIVYPTEGKIEINGLNIQSFTGDSIRITALPDSYDIAPSRQELLTILTNEARITGEVDVIQTGGSTAGIKYNTTKRF